MKRISVLCSLLFCAWAQPTLGSLVDPLERVGEFADYGLVKGKRTSSSIRSGALHAEIIAYMPTGVEGPFYTVLLDYDLVISLVGRKVGQERIDITSEFFTPEFMERLRTEGVVETPDFKIKHLGIDDVTTQYGQFFPSCDAVLLYDFPEKKKGKGTDTGFLEDLAGMIRELVDVIRGSHRSEIAGDPEQKFKDLTVKARIFQGVPVLGATQIDIKGKEKGFRYKAGFDLKPLGTN